MSKQFWGVIVIIVLLFVGIFALSGSKSDDSSKTGSKSSSSKATNHVTGKGSTGVKLVEYGDYECPYCEQYYTTVKAAQAEFGDQIFFQFRNFPLTSLHRNAFAAARAAEAASLQNKFWEMHDTLYENSNWQDWTAANNPNTYFNTYAQQLGLNITQFKKDFASTKVNDAINADMAEGNKLGITGTPTFFIDGKQVTIGNSQSDFEKVIKAAIAQKTSDKKN